MSESTEALTHFLISLLISKIKLKLRKTRKGQERGRLIDSGHSTTKGPKLSIALNYKTDLGNWRI